MKNRKESSCFFSKAVIALITICFIAIVFLGCGATLERTFFSGLSSAYYHVQTDAIFHGAWALSPQIEAMDFDLAWYDGGVQQLWGLGVPLWMLVFDGVAKLFGCVCSDIVPLFALLTLFCLYTLSVSRLLERKMNNISVPLLFAVLVLFSPTMWIFFWGPKNIYEIACLYAHIFSLLLLLAVVRYAVQKSWFDFFLGCGLSGFVSLVRPTHGIYGVAGGCILLFLALRHWSRKSERQFFLYVLLGTIIILSGFIFLAWTNWTRFGSFFEFGHNLSFSANSIVYLTRFGNPCDECNLWVLSKELFFWLFTLPYMASYLEAPVLRWRDIYQPTFGISFLLFLTLSFLCLLCYAKTLFKASRRKMGFLSTMYSSSSGWKVTLVGSLVFWWGLSFGILFLFYLNFSTLSTRYIHDFAPSFMSGVFCLLFCSRGYWRKWIYKGFFK